RMRAALCPRPCRLLAQWLRSHHHQPWQGPQRGRSGRHRVLPVLPGTNLLTTPKPIHLRRLCVHNLKVALILLAALFSASVMAETKIAVVDLGAAIFGSDIAQSRQKELQGRSEYATLQAKYDSTAADIKALQKDAEAKSMTWSDDQKTEFQKKMEYLRADIELTARKLESEVRGLQNSIVRELQPKALEALQELVDQEGITVLLRSDAVLMAKPELNLTAKLTERLNSKTK